MITLTVQEICQACSGELLAGSPVEQIDSVSTDTRDGLEGALFIGLRGERFDGGEFIGEALEKGAAAVVAETAAARRLAASRQSESAGGQAIIAVDDTGAALKQIASLAASRSGAKVVAITGSSGKTSTKDILSGLLEPQLNVVASKASFNNEVGVPLTLLSVEADTSVIVVEMGMQARGEIGELCRITAPDIAVITNIGPAHLEYAGSLENIAAGKAEIAGCLPADGGLVVPYGEKQLEPYLKDVDVQKVTFGFDTGADIHPVSETITSAGLHTIIDCLGRELEIEFNFAARHHLLNAMAAIGAYYLLEQPLEALSEAAREIRLSRLRGEMTGLADGSLLINDCYNANPLSMESSLEYLVSVASGRRTIAILGDMGELGSQAVDYHRQVGRRASELGIDLLVGVGELAAGYLEGATGDDRSRQDLHYPDCESAIKAIGSVLEPGDAVLVKASRFMELERLCQALTGSLSGSGQEKGG